MNWADVFSVTGFAFNIGGVIVATIGIQRSWTAYGVGPMFPAAVAMRRRVAASARKLAFWRKGSVEVLLASGSAHAVGSASVRGVVRTSFEGELTTDEKIERLIRAVKNLGDEVQENRRDASDAAKRIEDRVTELASDVEVEHERLEAMVKDVAVGDVRLELVGLGLVTLGAVLSLAPVVLGP